MDIEKRADKIVEEFCTGENFAWAIDAVTQTRPAARACLLALLVADRMDRACRAELVNLLRERAER